MHIDRILILLECLGIFQLTLSMTKIQLLTEEQRHIVLCTNQIVLRHWLPRQSIFVSLPPARHQDTSLNLTHAHHQDEYFNIFDMFLRSISEGGRWSVEVSRAGLAEPKILNENFLKHDSYIIFAGVQNEQSDIVRSVSAQLEELQKRGSWNYRAQFVVVTSVPINVSTKELALQILEEMWKYYSVMNVLLVVSVSNFSFDDTVTDMKMTRENNVEIGLELLTWLPYTSPTHCDKLNEAVLIDRWNSSGEFVLNVSLFPEKVPKTFHGCITKVIAFTYPPAIIETPDKTYTGLEIEFLEDIFKKLNLTPEYNVSRYNGNNHFQNCRRLILKLEPASSDIAIGVLPFDASVMDIAEATIPYINFKVSWYIPCPKPFSNWRFMRRIFCLPASMYFYVLAIIAVVIMWFLAKCETRFNVRESLNYMTIIDCTCNVWAVIACVSVPQKPVSNSLRIFFIALVLYSFIMTSVYQTFFIGLLVNPGSEESIRTLNDVIESGIEYGYPWQADVQFTDPPYDIIKKNRKMCKSMYKCLERVVKHKDFATIFDSFHAEYFKTRLLFHNIHVPVCTLPEDMMTYRVSKYMAKGNPLKKRFNEIITYMLESGLYEKWKRNFMSKLRLSDQPMEDDDTDFTGFERNDVYDDHYLTQSLVHLIHLKLVFFILLMGHIGSTLVFLVEVLYYRAQVIG